VTAERIKAVNVFYSYAHKDIVLRDNLEKHLANLKRQEYITSWYDRDINAGQEWASEIDEHLKKAHIILLLISPDFMHSEYCYSVEMKYALKRHDDGEAYVIPIILRHVDWEGAPFSKLQMLPSLAKPIVSAHWHDADEAFSNVVKGIRKAIKDLSLTPGKHRFATNNDLHLLPSAQVPATPPVWNVPYHQNPFFTGRGKLLKLLHDKFNKKNNTRSFIYSQAICGLGGIGKSQVVVEYAFRYHDEYPFVLWVRAATRDTFIAAFVSLANLLNLPEKNEQKKDIVVAAVRRWLENNEKWLLILDDVDDVSMVYEFLPTVGNGHILLTTRAQLVGTIANMVEVEKMDVVDGALLLLRRAKILEVDAPLQHASKEERTLAEAIVVALDGLPLALDQAGAYIEETRCNLSEYLNLYQKLQYRMTLLQRRSHIPSSHPEPVTTTWLLSFQHIERANLASSALLSLCALLDPDAIPEEIITIGAADLGPLLRSVASDPFKLNEAIEELRKFSFVRRDPDAKLLNMHKLVQVVLLDRMDRRDHRLWARRAVQAVNRVLSHADLTTLAKIRRYLPQAQACLALSEQYNFAFPAVIRLLSEMVVYWSEYDLYEQSESLYKQTLAICLKEYGSEHFETATRLRGLAILYSKKKKYDLAEPLLRQSLTICEKTLGSEHPDTANNLADLASLYIDQNKYEQAESFLQQALAICEKVLGPEHPEVAKNLDLMAWLYYGQGNLEQTEPLLQRALAINKKVLGLEHPDTAITLNNLARLYTLQRKYDLAEPLLKQVLQIRERALGPTHPHTADTLNNLAQIYIYQGKYDLAESLLQQALVIHEEILGPEHLNTAHVLQNLAQLYIDNGRYELAELLLRRTLKVREKVLGPEHLNTATTLSNLAQLYILQEKYNQAEPFLRRSIAIREKILGPRSHYLVQSLERYANLLRKMNLEEKAISFEERAKAIQARSIS
jgi:tetratricopeptide (TPR) repeat protein